MARAGISVSNGRSGGSSSSSSGGGTAPGSAESTVIIDRKGFSVAPELQPGFIGRKEILGATEVTTGVSLEQAQQRGLIDVNRGGGGQPVDPSDIQVEGGTGPGRMTPEQAVQFEKSLASSAFGRGVSSAQVESAKLGKDLTRFFDRGGITREVKFAPTTSAKETKKEIKKETFLQKEWRKFKEGPQPPRPIRQSSLVGRTIKGAGDIGQNFLTAGLFTTGQVRKIPGQQDFGTLEAPVVSFKSFPPLEAPVVSFKSFSPIEQLKDLVIKKDKKVNLHFIRDILGEEGAKEFARDAVLFGAFAPLMGTSTQVAKGISAQAEALTAREIIETSPPIIGGKGRIKTKLGIKSEGGESIAQLLEKETGSKVTKQRFKTYFPGKEGLELVESGELSFVETGKLANVGGGRSTGGRKITGVKRTEGVDEVFSGVQFESVKDGISESRLKILRLREGKTPEKFTFLEEAVTKKVKGTPRASLEKTKFDFRLQKVEKLPSVDDILASLPKPKMVRRGPIVSPMPKGVDPLKGIAREQAKFFSLDSTAKFDKNLIKGFGKAQKIAKGEGLLLRELQSARLSVQKGDSFLRGIKDIKTKDTGISRISLTDASTPKIKSNKKADFSFLAEEKVMKKVIKDMPKVPQQTTQLSKLKIDLLPKTATKTSRSSIPSVSEFFARMKSKGKLFTGTLRGSRVVQGSIPSVSSVSRIKSKQKSDLDSNLKQNLKINQKMKQEMKQEMKLSQRMKLEQGQRLKLDLKLQARARATPGRIIPHITPRPPRKTKIPPVFYFEFGKARLKGTKAKTKAKKKLGKLIAEDFTIRTLRGLDVSGREVRARAKSIAKRRKR